MKKLLLIIFVFIAQVSFGQITGNLTPGIDLSGITTLEVKHIKGAIATTDDWMYGGSLTDPYRDESWLYSTIDSVSHDKPKLLITIHKEFQDLSSKKKLESLVAIEKWILSEKLKLKK